jgi:hypothetical protein
VPLPPANRARATPDPNTCEVIQRHHAAGTAFFGAKLKYPSLGADVEDRQTSKIAELESFQFIGKLCDGLPARSNHTAPTSIE